jgi:hypothetical protein
MDDQSHASVLTDSTASPTSAPQTPDAAAPSDLVSEPAKPGFRWGVFVQHLCTVVISLIVIGGLAGFVMGYRPLHREARRNVAAIPAKVEVVWPELPVPKGTPPKTWLPEQFQQQILKLALDQLGDSPAVFSRDPLESVGIALEQSGWFDGRPKVSRVGDNTVRIEGSWRLPAAVVRSGGKDLLLSWSGRQMPAEYETNMSGLVVILPVSSPRPVLSNGAPDFQTPWGGEDLAAALELLSTVKAHPWSSQIAGIDITDYEHSQQLSLLTRNETRIVWGGRPSKPLLGETSSASKLERIGEINRRFARIDAAKQAIDISGVHAVEINIAASAETPAEDGAEKSVRHARLQR